MQQFPARGTGKEAFGEGSGLLLETRRHSFYQRRGNLHRALRLDHAGRSAGRDRVGLQATGKPE